jgi:hypothetical protein
MDIQWEIEPDARITDLIPSFPYDVRGGGVKVPGEIRGMYTVVCVEFGSTIRRC